MSYVFEDPVKLIKEASDAVSKNWDKQRASMRIDYSVRPPAFWQNTPDGWVKLNIGDSIEI